MEINENKKLREVVFERLLCGEESNSLRLELVRRLSEDEADQAIADAQSRIDKGKEDSQFQREARKIQRRRLVNHKFLSWKLLGGSILVWAAFSMILGSLTHGGVAIPFGGLLVGGSMLAWVEWRENRLVDSRLGGDE